MSSRSRWGGYRKGKKLFKDQWDSVKEDADLDNDEDEQAPATFPSNISEFQYVFGKGIWDLTSTNQFPKMVTNVSMPIGLSQSLLNISGPNNAWTQQTIDISAYAGTTSRLVFKYENGAGFNGDLQIDLINIDGNTYSFENQTHSFETSNTNTANYTDVSWGPLGVERGVAGKWQVAFGSTPSGSTGINSAADGSHFVYAETSSPANVAGYTFWLRSPELVLGASPTLTFFEGRNGANIGTLDVYIEVIA